MSSFVVLIGDPVRPDLNAKLPSLIPGGEGISDASDCCVISSRKSSTVWYATGRDPAENNFFVLAGSPFLLRNGYYSSLSESDFQRLLTEDASDIHGRLFGQYSIARSFGHRIELFSDPNGLRSLFMAEFSGQIVFSTHLHLITQIIPHAPIDFEAFGSHWLAHNQLSTRSLVKGISRICGPEILSVDAAPSNHGRRTVTVSRFKNSDSPIVRDSNEPRDPFLEIRGFLRNFSGNVKLALSGGIDSRMLFALALKERKGNFETFVYGKSDDNDVILAQHISDQSGVKCRFVGEMSMREMIETDLLIQYGTETFSTTPLSASRHSANYEKVFSGDRKTIVLDGAFGEIGRGQFYRKIELLRLISRISIVRPSQYMSALSFSRADIFSKFTSQIMATGFAADTIDFMTHLLECNGTRKEDQAASRYRRQNFFGYGQSWIDQFGLNLMPFGQNRFIKAILDIPVQQRRGSTYYKKSIKQLASHCTSIPLVKGDQTYPFGLHQDFLPALFRVRKMFRQNQLRTIQKPSPYAGLREFVYDIIRSQDSRTFVHYDIDKIDQIADGFFGGRSELSGQLDWFLSFELWRRGNHLS